MLDSISLPSQWNRKKSLVAKWFRLRTQTFTHTDREVLLDDKKRVGKAAGLSEDTMVRGLVEFEYPIQIESH